MNDETNILWTISELAAQVAAALAEVAVDQASGRVTETPSTRTIRYYTTHGLLDGPVDFKGRTALYGRRHLLQLVAIKQLQSRGEALADVQARVAGATDAELAKLAGLSADGAAKPKVARREESFWGAPVADVTEPPQEGPAPLETAPAVRLGPDALLVLHGAVRDLHPDDMEALRVAAEPLLKLLKLRHITGEH